MATRKLFGLKVLDGETAKYTAVIKDENGTAINITLSASLTSMTITYYNKATGATINTRNAQDVLGTPSMGVYPGANNHTLASNGTLTWKLAAADTNFVTTANVTVVARYIYVYPDAQSVARTGIHEFEFTIEKLDTVS